MPKPSSRKDGRAKPLPLASLTGREKEVLHWIVEGKRDAEIADILAISVNTVHKHVQHILAKLRVETRTAAARVALRDGRDGAAS